MWRNFLNKFGTRFARTFQGYGPVNFVHLFVKNNRQIAYATGAAAGGTALWSISIFGKKEPVSGKNEQDSWDQNADLVIREADLLYDAYMIENVHNLLKRFRTSENPELLWRLARCICELGKMEKKDAAKKKQLFSEALEIAEKAVKCEPATGSFGAHKWYAIILNYNTQLEGTKAQLTKCQDVKAHLERALEINHLDPTTWHILGVWHFTFADLPSHYRLAARLLYAKPPSSTFDEALRHFERAEALQRNFYSANHYYLALTYEHLNRAEEALTHMKKAFAFPVHTADDSDIHKKAAAYLKKKHKFTDEQLYQTMKEFA